MIMCTQPKLFEIVHKSNSLTLSSSHRASAKSIKMKQRDERTNNRTS